MKKVPLNPEHRAGQKKIRKMLAAGLPLAVLMSGLSGCDSEMPPKVICGAMPPEIVDKELPREPVRTVHVVKEGDTLETIARQYDTTVAKLKELNSLTDEQADRIKPGQEIKLT